MCTSSSHWPAGARTERGGPAAARDCQHTPLPGERGDTSISQGKGSDHVARSQDHVFSRLLEIDYGAQGVLQSS